MIKEIAALTSAVTVLVLLFYLFITASIGIHYGLSDQGCEIDRPFKMVSPFYPSCKLFSRLK